MNLTTQIELLLRHNEKIDEKDFDLEAWKSTAVALISKVFGSDDSRIASIDGLKIDYGSWALRDASSKYDPVATCKRKARDIMELSIAELKSEAVEKSSQLVEALKDALTGTQFKEISTILESKKSKSAKHKALSTKLKSLKAPVLSEILATLLVKG